MNTEFRLTETVMLLQSRHTVKAVTYAAAATGRFNGTNLFKARFGHDQRTWGVGFGSAMNVTGESIRRTRGLGLKRRC